MEPLQRIRLKTLGWFLLLPFTFIGLLPWWLHQQIEGAFAWEGGLGQWIGLWLILDGVGLAGWCVNLFNVEGLGTPVPFDPPTRFVVTGPYQYVRNPMVLGLLLILSGEAALYRSPAVLLYSLGLAVLAGLFVRFVEEPDLERRFGASYRAYKQHVPRWIPKAPRR